MMTAIFEWILGLEPGRLSVGDWRFDLLGDASDYLRLGLVCGIGVLSWITIRCYRREGKTHPRWRAWLTGVRIATIILLALVLLQPGVVLRIQRTLYSTVLVVIDDSLSMNLADRWATDPATRTALAKALKDTDDPTTLTRSQIAQRILFAPDGPLESLRETHPIEVLAFSTDQPGKESYTRQIARLARRGTAAADADSGPKKLGLTAGGYDTNLSAAVRDAVDRFQGRRITAMVVVSDGQPTNPDAMDHIAAAVDHAGSVRRFTVRVGDPTPPKHVGVMGLRAPREIRGGAPAEFRILINQRNLTGKAADVRLYRRKVGEAWPADLLETEPVSSRAVTLSGEPVLDAPGQTQGTQSVKLDVNAPAEELGEYVYRAVVVRAGKELDDANPGAEAFVRVTDKRIRILLISSDAGWEFRYLRSFFLRQPELFQLSVWQQNADPEVNQSASTGMKLTRLPRSLKELIDSGKEKPTATVAPAKEGDKKDEKKGDKEIIPPGYHVVILYDPAPTKDGFDAKFMELLKEFVGTHRGGLAYIASPKHTYEVLRDPAAKPLADLLPVVVEESRDDVNYLLRNARPQAWPLQLTTYGTDHPVTRLDGGGSANERMWSILPGVFRTQAVRRVKPTARLLAVRRDPTERDSHVVGEPVLAVHTMGAGRVAFIGSDETWRWRFVDDGFFHRRLWSNLVRYLAPLSARQVVITTGGDRFSLGQEIPVEVEAYDANYKPIVTETLDVVLTDTATGTAKKHTVQAVVGQAGQYTGRLTVDQTGTYVLSVDESIAKAKQVASKQIIVELPQDETRRGEANERTLHALASNDETYLPIERAGELAERIGNQTLTTVEQQQFSLWDTPAMWTLLVLLLTFEWFVRKRINLM